MAKKKGNGSFVGWMARGILGAIGGAFIRVIRDAHTYCYGRWPGVTLLVYLGIFIIFFLVGLTR